MRVLDCNACRTDILPAAGETATVWKPERNRVLRALCPSDQNKVFPSLKVIELRKGEFLYENGPESHFMYFPIDAVLTLRHILLDGHGCDLARVGWEGMIGLVLFRETISTPYCIQVQFGGHALRLKSGLMLTVAEKSMPFRSLLLSCFHAVMMQIAQSVACNRHHTIQQQFCRYMLDALDHGTGDVVKSTHDQIASSLGVRREGVTEAAIRLQKQRLIQYHRGHIKVIDRGGMESRSCECYAVVKRQIRELLPR